MRVRLVALWCIPHEWRCQTPPSLFWLARGRRRGVWRVVCMRVGLAACAVSAPRNDAAGGRKVSWG